MDFSRYMNQVLEVNAEELWARVQPGLVQDELNHHVRPMGLLFGPDTSTSNRATLGGMMGNNSGGSHSIAYGLTVDHVIEITRAARRRLAGRLRRGDAGRVRGQVPRARDWRAQIYREMARHPRARTRTRSARAIRALAPRGRLQPQRAGRHRRAAALLAGGGNGRPRPFSMARLIVGSEGTLADHPRGEGAAGAAAQGHRARRHPLPRHPGGARVLAVHPGDRARTRSS